MAGITHKLSLLTRNRWTSTLAVLGIASVLLSFVCHYDFTADFEGIYLLRCNRGLLFDVQNDLLLGEENRLLAKFEFESIYRLIHGGEKGAPHAAHLNYSWSKRNGSGFVFNYFPDGKQLLTCFSRFRDSQDLVPKGLFVGGGLPYSKHDDLELTMSATGMAHYDGKEWHHLWCNANETIASTPDDKHDPSTWTFLGSKVLHASDSKLVLRSSHELPFSKTVLRIDRFAIFRAGETYFTLIIRIANVGSNPTDYYYVYGDEPWVGEFGTSVGNVGWTKDGLYNYETALNPLQHSYAGMYDIGNPLILGGKSKYSGMANFIEWIGDTKPSLVYFSNKEGQVASEEEKVPLYSKDNRVIFLQWGPRPLVPGKQELLIMAIGMADGTTKSAVPLKPEVRLDPADARFLFQ